MSENVYKDLEWKLDTREFPDKAIGYIGTAPGMQVVVVTWLDGETLRADGASTHMSQGLVRRLTPAEAKCAAEAALAATKD